MKFDLIKAKLNDFLTEKRMKHSIGVSKSALRLAKLYGYDEDKVYIASMLHDVAKCLDKSQLKDYVDKYKIKLDCIEKTSTALSHSIIGAYIAEKEFCIRDKNILNAIRYHTTGKEDMNLLEKIIYLADLIEENRVYPCVEELRNLAYNGRLDDALLLSFNNNLEYIISRNILIHPRTVLARNFLLK